MESLSTPVIYKCFLSRLLSLFVFNLYPFPSVFSCGVLLFYVLASFCHVRFPLSFILPRRQRQAAGPQPRLHHRRQRCRPRCALRRRPARRLPVPLLPPILLPAGEVGRGRKACRPFSPAWAQTADQNPITNVAHLGLPQSSRQQFHCAPAVGMPFYWH